MRGCPGAPDGARHARRATRASDMLGKLSNAPSSITARPGRLPRTCPAPVGLVRGERTAPCPRRIRQPRDDVTIAGHGVDGYRNRRAPGVGCPPPQVGDLADDLFDAQPVGRHRSVAVQHAIERFSTRDRRRVSADSGVVRAWARRRSGRSLGSRRGSACSFAHVSFIARTRSRSRFMRVFESMP
jgi:hypothetical protein